MTRAVAPGKTYRISPALWEEPRCYWRTGGVDKVVTLRALPKQSGQEWEWESLYRYREPTTTESKGSDGFL